MASYELALIAKWIIPMVPGPNNDYRVVYEDHAILVNNGVIEKIVSSKDIANENVKTIVKGSKTSLIVPGLINMHTHLPMSPLRAMFEDLPLLQWLDKIMPLENMLLSTGTKDKFMRVGTELGIYESLINGTTCCNDMYYHSDHVIDIAEKIGFRLYTVSDPHGCETPADKAKALQERVDCIKRAKTENEKRKYAKAIAGFHGCYTSSKESQTKIIKTANDENLLIHIHCHETVGEMDLFKNTDGCTAIERLNEIGGLNERSLLAHCVHMTDEEIALFSSKKVNVIHNPRSNMKLGSGICRVRDILDANINMCLGTDSSSSNNSLSMLSEMQFATLLSKLKTGNPASLTAYDALKMATINGAKALNVQDKLGSLEKGKLCDAVFFELSPGGHDFPILDPLDHLVYTNFGVVTDVFINGNPMVRDSKVVCMNIDWDEQRKFVKEALETSKQTKLSERVQFG